MDFYILGGVRRDPQGTDQMKAEPITPGHLYLVTDNRTGRRLDVIAPNTWAAMLLGFKSFYF